jgi:hypothetical protein
MDRRHIEVREYINKLNAQFNEDNIERLVKHYIKNNILRIIFYSNGYQYTNQIGNYCRENINDLMNYRELHQGDKTLIFYVYNTLIENRDYINFTKCYNIMKTEVNARAYNQTLYKLPFDVLQGFIENMEIPMIEKIKIIIEAYCISQNKEPIFEYLSNIFENIELSEIYQEMIEYLIKMCYPIRQIMHHIHQIIDINNNHLTKLLLKHNHYAEYFFTYLQEEGYNFLPNKNKFLDKQINQMLKSLSFIQYLIENGAVPTKMERKKFLKDNEEGVIFLNEHGIRSV